MKPVDPTEELLRLREGAGSDLSSALRELSARGPDATELASLASRLSLQGVAMAPTATPPGGAVPRGAWKWAVTGTAVISGVGLWLWSRPPSAVSSAQPASAVPATPVTASRPGVVAPPKMAGVSRERARAPLALPAPEATPNSPQENPSVLPTSSLPPSVAPPASVAQREAVGARREVVATPAEASPARPLSREAPRPSRPIPAEPSAAAGVDAPTDATQPSELELLRGARLSLKSSPAEALRQAEQHRASYPAGKLTQERELIAISALMALGRRTAALSRASRFEQAFPTSPYRKQIGELLR